MTKKRLFVAIDLPDPLRDELEQMQGRFQHLVQDAKWVKPSGIHLTLKFLGYVDPEKLPEIESSLSHISKQFSPVSISVKGCGFFPNVRRPSVVWAGVQSEALLPLQQEVENAMDRIGFEKENRAFHPHLTLARLKNTRGSLPFLAKESEKWKSKDLGYFTAQSFVLFESILKRDGAEYHKLKEFPLIATTDEHR